MKKIFSGAALVVASVVFGQGIKFEEGKFASVLAKAKKENKLVMVDSYASWCGPCKQMAKNIFPKKEVGDFYNANFVSAKIDMEKGEGPALAKKYGVKAYPTYLFLNSDGELVHTAVGYFEAEDFIGKGKVALDPSKRISAQKAKFEKGEKDPAFLMDLMKATAYTDRELFVKAANRYFANKKENTIAREEIGFLLSSVETYDDAMYRRVQQYRPELLKVVPEEKMIAFEKSMKKNAVMKASYNKDTKTLNEKIYRAESAKYFNEAETEQNLVATKLNLALSAKDYKTYADLAVKKYGDGKAFESDELNSVAWTFFEKITDPTLLKKAQAWAQESVNKNESYANTDTLANILNKTGDKAAAIKWAQRSIELAQKTGEDYGDTQKLLDSIK